MLLAAGFIAMVIVLEAGPVYQVFMADFRGRSLSGLQWAWLFGSFALVVLLCVLAVILPELAEAVLDLFPGAKLGKEWRFRRSILDRWLDEQMLGGEAGFAKRRGDD